MFKNMKIGKKLVMSFVIVAIIASISGVMGAYIFAKADKDYSAALEDYGFASGKIGRLGMYVNYGRAVIRDIVFQSDEAILTTSQKTLAEIDVGISTSLDEIRATNTSDQAKKVFATIESEFVEYNKVRDRVVALGMVNDNEKAYALWMSEASPLVNSIADNVDTLMQINYDAGYKVSNALTALGNIMLMLMVGCIVLGLVLSVIFGFVISRGISKPIISVENAAQKISKGDYDIDLTYNSRDEVGSLAESMRTMCTTTKAVILDTERGLAEIAGGNFNISPKAEYIGVFKGIESSMVKIIVGLSETMSQIKIASDQVASGSNQVSSSAQSLAQGATEQASSIEELSASIAEIAEKVRTNAENAIHANQTAVVVSTNVETSNEQMSQMMGAMEEISTSSAEISKIIKAIEDIAFQTNILALNAAVEAARAGAAGKGFAVVADEVRNLATKSSEAAKQTNALIENSVKSVERGSRIADDTSKSLAEVVIGSKEIADLIAKISDASHEQTSAINQINLGVDQISMVVQTNSATSEESAAASEELSTQAVLTQSLVAKFEILSPEALKSASMALGMAPVKEIAAPKTAPRQITLDSPTPSSSTSSSASKY